MSAHALRPPSPATARLYYWPTFWKTKSPRKQHFQHKIHHKTWYFNTFRWKIIKYIIKKINLQVLAQAPPPLCSLTTSAHHLHQNSKNKTCTNSSKTWENMLNIVLYYDCFILNVLIFSFENEIPPSSMKSSTWLICIPISNFQNNNLQCNFKKLFHADLLVL